MKDIMVACKKCGNKALASSMKLDFDEKLMICPDCVKNKNIHKEIEEKVLKKGKEIVEESEERPSRMTHKCASCGYTFRINLETKTPKNCPYCDKKILGF